MQEDGIEEPAPPEVAMCAVSEAVKAANRTKADALRSGSCRWCGAAGPLEWASVANTNARDYYRCTAGSACGYFECVVHPAAIMRETHTKHTHLMQCQSVEGEGADRKAKMACALDSCRRTESTSVSW